jgi:hypothetical protein
MSRLSCLLQCWRKWESPEDSTEDEPCPLAGTLGVGWRHVRGEQEQRWGGRDVNWGGTASGCVHGGADGGGHVWGTHGRRGVAKCGYNVIGRNGTTRATVRAGSRVYGRADGRGHTRHVLGRHGDGASLHVDATRPLFHWRGCYRGDATAGGADAAWGRCRAIRASGLGGWQPACIGRTPDLVG